MYVCLCHAVTDQQLRQAVHNGATRMCDLSRELGVASDCGKCACLANQLRKEAILDAPATSLARSVA